MDVIGRLRQEDHQKKPREFQHQNGPPSKKDLFQNKLSGAGEIVRWLRALSALRKDLGSISHMAAHNDLLTPVPMPSFADVSAAFTGCTKSSAHRRNTYTHKIKVKTKQNTSLQQHGKNTFQHQLGNPCYVPTVPSNCCYSTLSAQLLASCCPGAQSLREYFFHSLFIFW